MILLECPQEVSQNEAKDKSYVCRFLGIGECSLYTVLHGGTRTFRTRDGAAHRAASKAMYNFVD